MTAGARSRAAVRVEAPAKINLSLEVLGRRADGFHELETVLQAIDLVDEVTLELRSRRAEVPADAADVRLTMDAEAHTRDVPDDDSNLARRAAVAWLEAAGRAGEVGLDLALTKRIPAGAGLAGGSSDAGAVLRGLQELLAPGLAPDALAAVAAELGSDVTFFLHGGTALCTGRGERVAPLPSPAPFELQLLLPDFGLSTPEVYGALGAAPCEPTAPEQDGPRVAAWAERLEDADLAALETLFRNDLEAPARRLRPQVSDFLDLPGVHLSGSGSTCFVLGPAAPALAAECQRRCIRLQRVRSKNR